MMIPRIHRNLFRTTCLAGLSLLLAANTVFAQDGSRRVESRATASKSSTQNLPRVAVTDLSYEEKVSQHFIKYDRSSSSSASQGASGGPGGYSGNSQMQAQTNERLETGTETLIDRGELRKFTGDVKGEIIKTRKFRLTQGRPWLKKDTDTLYDIIARIKDGYYPNADYVMFGSVTSVDARKEASPIQGSSAVNHALSFELLVEFSVINTKTYEIIAAFSARGEGSDARLVSGHGGGAYTLSRSKALSEMSRSLGQAAAAELVSQLDQPDAAPTRATVRQEEQEEKVINFR